MFESVEHILDHVPDVFTLLTHLSAIIARIVYVSNIQYYFWRAF